MPRVSMREQHRVRRRALALPILAVSDKAEVSRVLEVGEDLAEKMKGAVEEVVLHIYGERGMTALRLRHRIRRISKSLAEINRKWPGILEDVVQEGVVYADVAFRYGMTREYPRQIERKIFERQELEKQLKELPRVKSLV